MKTTVLLMFILTSGGASIASGQSFVNFESPQVHPIDVTPDGSLVLVTNTADNRLEILDRSPDGTIRNRGSVPVGLEPVSVRAFDADRAWVVNHLSDSITVVDLRDERVIATLSTGDEPADVVFAGTPIRGFVSISQENRIMVFDPGDLSATPSSIPVRGEDPRALATDGSRIYGAIFEAGNLTTVLSEHVVKSSVNPYPGDQNPPPNAGSIFEPPLNPKLPAAPAASMIVRRDDDGSWIDDNGADWSEAVSWDLHGHGLVVIDARSLSTSYRTGLPTTNMACAIRPDGGVVVVGTEAFNEVRFEPNLAGRFIHVEGALVEPGSGAVIRRDLNPHLDYSNPTIPLAERLQSLGDPRGVVCSPAGDEIWITGMGSDNVIVHDAGLSRTDRIVVGSGPTGVVMDPTGTHVYVLNRFDASVTGIERSSREIIGVQTLFDPTPIFINEGRPFLYDTHLTSGLGHVSCGSCHVDARIDQLGWDLGDPSGTMKPFNQDCNVGQPQGFCKDWHPMKGPMTTQTLVGLEGTAPFHWRGDRENFAAFDHAFSSLLGNDADGTPEEMAAMRTYLASIAFPPNPNREIDGSLPDEILGGDPDRGRDNFENGGLAVINCDDCHSLPSGSFGSIISGSVLGEDQGMKIAPLRALYEKQGMDKNSMEGGKGFGFLHDGSDGSLFEFFHREVFTFPPGESGEQIRRDVTAFMLCWEGGTHAGIGVQAEIGGPNPDSPALRDLLMSLALAGEVDLVVRVELDGRMRGGLLRLDGQVQTDALAQSLSIESLDAMASPTVPIVYTLVPRGSGVRIGLDRDLDGFFDQDEMTACADPADPESTPLNSSCGPDLDGDGRVGGTDLGLLFSAWGICSTDECSADFNRDGVVGPDDLGTLLAAWTL